MEWPTIIVYSSIRVSKSYLFPTRRVQILVYSLREVSRSYLFPTRRVQILVHSFKGGSRSYLFHKKMVQILVYFPREWPRFLFIPQEKGPNSCLFSKRGSIVNFLKWNLFKFLNRCFTITSYTFPKLNTFGE